MPVDRTDLSLHAATLLRERAARVSASAGRPGTLRERFVREQRAHLVTWLLPTLAAVVALTGIVAGTELVSGGARGPAVAVAAASTAMAIAAFSGLVYGLRKSPSVFAASAIACGATSFGWALVVRASGAEESLYLFVLPMALLTTVSVPPLPPRVAAIVGGVGCASLLLVGFHAPAVVYLVTAVVASGGFLLARIRQQRTLRDFVRVERLHRSAVRMQRLHAQLVVVEKLEALRVLVGGMAHELNNALTVSLASVQLAKRKAQDDSGAAISALTRGEGGLTRIRTTVERLRRFAMASEGVVEPADVAAMLDFALESAIGRARSGLVIERRYEEGVGPVQCHAAALAEALFQIARNAVEAMPAGGTLTASVVAAGDRVVLSLEDEGKGIAASQMKRVFDPYYASTETKSGMGLSAVYGMVSAFGGTLKIESTEGEGTRVSVRLPRTPTK